MSGAPSILVFCSILFFPAFSEYLPSRTAIEKSLTRQDILGRVFRDLSNTTPTDTPIPLLASPLKGEEHSDFPPIQGWQGGGRRFMGLNGIKILLTKKLNVILYAK